MSIPISEQTVAITVGVTCAVRQQEAMCHEQSQKGERFGTRMRHCSALTPTPLKTSAISKITLQHCYFLDALAHPCSWSHHTTTCPQTSKSNRN